MIQKIGSYNIIKKIASGGMATIYLASHKDTKVKAAIKLLKEELQDKEKITDRFTQEGLLKLNHPNIVKVLAVGTHSNTPYIVMDYIEGSDLEEVIKSKGRLPVKKALNIFTQILQALSYVHKKGIIHRDIKPKNILIDKDGNVKLTDFGIAKSLYSHIKTATGGYLGAPAYSSPEQMDGKEVDIRSDIYSLGITLYEMLAGRVPFSSTSFDVIVKEKFSDSMIPITKHRSDIPDYIKSIINKCVSKLPRNRFRNVKEIINIIDGNTSSKTVVKQNLAPPKKVNTLAIIFGVLSVIFILIIIILVIRLQSKPDVIVETVTETVIETVVDAVEPEEKIDEILAEESPGNNEEGLLSAESIVIGVINDYIDAIGSKDFDEQRKYVAKYALDLVNLKEFEDKHALGAESRTIDREDTEINKVTEDKAEGHISFIEHIKGFDGSIYDLITEGKIYLERIEGDWKIVDYTRKNHLISEALYNFEGLKNTQKDVTVSMDWILFSTFDEYVALHISIINDSDLKLGTGMYGSTIIGPDRIQNEMIGLMGELGEIFPNAIAIGEITYNWTNASVGNLTLYFGDIYREDNYDNLINDLIFEIDLSQAVRY